MSWYEKDQMEKTKVYFKSMALGHFTGQAIFALLSFFIWAPLGTLSLEKLIFLGKEQNTKFSWQFSDPFCNSNVLIILKELTLSFTLTHS